MSRLLEAAGSAPFLFVVGKGGVGKTTAAGALALELADSGIDTHLISTDPAHSLGDLFMHDVGGDPIISPCSARLLIEEFDAGRTGDVWLERALGPVTELVEAGTYLDAEDVRAFSRLALPGLDEMMAVLRLSELADGGRRIVVDTAPTGHTLRLLDAGAIHAGIADALRAMAAKASAVAGALTGAPVRLAGERIIAELVNHVDTYRTSVLAPAAFIVASRPGRVVAAETGRLLVQLEQRNLRVAAVLLTGASAKRTAEPPAELSAGAPVESVAFAARRLHVELLADVTGCSGLRMWSGHVHSGHNRVRGPGPQSLPPGAGTAAEWLAAHAPRLLLFAGKGGVGKSTCAAAAALILAEDRDVLLCSTDPAGSLGDVLDSDIPVQLDRLRVMQIDAAAELSRLRASYEEEIVAALERLGLSASASLDRAVIESLWNLAPPGLDELAATAAMLGAARSGEHVVIDSAPTGHFLRLLEMPDLALGWTRQLMRVVVKYGIAGAAEDAAQSLLDLARELRSLRDTLHAPDSAAVIAVTLDEPLVRAETDRLTDSLADAGIRVAAVLLNRAAPDGDTNAAPDREVVLIAAPDVEPPPVGRSALRGFAGTWNIVA